MAAWLITTTKKAGQWLRATLFGPNPEQRYLAEAKDVADLERRMRLMERRGNYI